jgi:multidrug efflux pump subunit AcrA (membrane-fusion protein)
MRRKRPVGRIVLALAVLAVAVAVAAGKLRPVAVTTTPIVRGTAIEAVYATGTVEPFDRVVVKAKAAGSIDLKVREGAIVKRGDLIATIDSATLRHDLERGRADLWAASQQATSDGPQLAALEAQARSMRAEMNTIQSDRARTARLVSTGAVPQAELDRIVDRAASLQAQLEANAAQQKSMRIDLTARATGSSAAVDSLAARLADAEVRAPIDGVVLARFVEPGEVAMVNSPLVKIGTADNLILECAIDEADIGKVMLGKRVAISLYAFPQTIAKGEVFEILPDADRVKKSFLAKVRFVDPPMGLRSGMTAEANVVIDEHPGALLAPGEAVDSAGAVFLVSDGRVHRLTPRLGVRDMLRVEVLDGLREGDPVVVSGAAALQEGKRVHATTKPPFDGVAPSSVTRSKMSL